MTANADRQRAYRARNGARTGQPGPKPVRPCGTLAAHRRHVRHGEAPCAACRAAYNAEHRRLYAARDRGG